MDKNELLKYLICEIDLVMHDKDYRFENEDGTWYSRESCKNLTNEEVFEELKTELRQLAKIEDDFADLEAKLAESEEKYNDSKELWAEQFHSLTEQINILEQQLAEKEKEIAVLEEQDGIYHNQTAIAVLEEVLDNEVYINSKLDFEDGNYVLSKIIRTKIEELKNGRN